MKEKSSSSTSDAASVYQPLFNALRKEDGDARIWELMENLRARGQSRDMVMSQVVKALGASAGVRVQKIAHDRAHFMATGTMQRYKPSRMRRFRRWWRGIQESLEDRLSRRRPAG